MKVVYLSHVFSLLRDFRLLRLGVLKNIFPFFDEMFVNIYALLMSNLSVIVRFYE